MPRAHKPWYRENRDTWFVEISGRQHSLCKGSENRKLAEREMHKLLSSQDEPTTDEERRGVLVLFAKFLRWTKKKRSSSTYDQYRYYLKSFVRFRGVRRMPPQKITIDLVEDWLDSNPSWGSRRHPIMSLLRAFNWAVKRQLIAKNPLVGIEVPGKTRCVNFLTAEQRQAILSSIKDEAFKNFVIAMSETGCRPGEIWKVTAENVNFAQGTWRFEEHKTAKATRKPRVVYLTDRLKELTLALMKQNPKGPLFLNSRGKPWKRNSIRCRFMRLRGRFPEFDHFSAYSYRRAYVTDALERGVDSMIVAELVGHKSTEMISRHYSQLQKRIQHMRSMAEKVIN